MSPRRMFRSKVGWTSAAAVITVAGVLAGTMLASAAGPNLPKRTPAQLLLALRNAEPPKSMTAVLTETANLGFPSLPNIAGLNNSVFSASSLISGTHTVDIWYADPQHVRIALPVSFGETDLRINGDQAWLWNSHGQTATHYLLPTPAQRKAARAARLKMFKSQLPLPIGRCIGTLRPATTRSREANRKVIKCLRFHMAHPVTGKPDSSGWGNILSETQPPTPQQAVNRFLAMVGKTTKVTVDGTTQVAGRSAYQLVIEPRTDQSLIDRIVIAVDGQTSLPLQFQVFARGVTDPAFQFGFTSLSFAKPAMSNFTFTPPAGAHVKTERLPATGLPGLFGPPGLVGPTTKSFATRAGTFSGAPPVFISRPVGWRTGKHGLVRTRFTKVGAASTVVIHATVQPDVQVMGKGWLSVAVIPAENTLSGLLSGGWQANPDSKVHGLRENAVRLSPSSGPPALGQLTSLLPVLLKAATPVHGAWGSGRLLRTNLFSVLITSKGKVLIGAVTPAVLYADAAKAK
ncbi:MAG TPA: hypothetical protein VFI65_14850 [Streptosporangiaceae bacterium]|nr:hypothetical protein [Streptosporangiaceae bacterium]